LAFDKLQGLFLLSLRRAAEQIAVQFIFKVAFDCLCRESMFHDHQRRILRHAFRQHSISLDVGIYYLMTPPLMGYLMSGNIIGHVQVSLRMGNPENESKTL